MSTVAILQSRVNDLIELNRKFIRLMRDHKANTPQGEHYRSEYRYNLDLITSLENRINDLNNCELYKSFLLKHSYWIKEEEEYRDKVDRSSINQTLKIGLLKNSTTRGEILRLAIKRLTR